MNHFSHKLFLSIAVIATVLLMFNQYVEGIIGDSGMPSQRGIIDDNQKQSLLQDVAKIKEEIKILQTKLNKAQEGENLYILRARLSVNNLKALLNSLSTKINAIQKNQRSTGNIQKLSEGASKGIIIVNGLDQKVGANMKSDSLKLLNELSELLIGLENDIKITGNQLLGM